MKKTIGGSNPDLDSVRDFLVAHGNPLLRQDYDKEGYHAVFRDPLDWALLYANFQFDPQELLVYERPGMHGIERIGEGYQIVHWPPRKAP